VAFLGTGLALLNFGIDEFINPRLRAAGLSRRRARRAGLTGAARPPRRFVLGVTPVVRSEPLTAVNGSASRQSSERSGAGADPAAPGRPGVVRRLRGRNTR
jgi:peptide/nickel transport system permease protein